MICGYVTECMCLSFTNIVRVIVHIAGYNEHYCECPECELLQPLEETKERVFAQEIVRSFTTSELKSVCFIDKWLQM